VTLTLDPVYIREINKSAASQAAMNAVRHALSEPHESEEAKLRVVARIVEMWEKKMEAARGGAAASHD
jgi:hypothetical protein